ncbi:hypothetical protein M409DRAFT_24062 [Zasmidium cellare ATCC 36951]|uniref:NADH:flavin oxidoreductase/NADH oxidase N-terminal domain-containing protein n=1 Tax=Zasmidium cellare ATCC 36951 TaxID=1080233 RepID=A0A6A6CK23_ZASCE|nr:uncharacterized protein M409DRAFT_24062 [Zasmidium cellare ATCC 36951]KAF2165776.1 hypothetical protein M409DRAFT_24062 [Zasmidium cellare ATCC 36951]
MADRLFKPIKVGNSLLKNRVVMAPLTRFRADKDHNVSEHAKEYYEQRASVPGTLLITEATFVSGQAGGYPNIPGIWSETQIAGWKDVVDAVHKKGSFIYLQLWGLGRVAQEKVLQEEGGWKVRSASAIAVPAEQTSTGKAGTTPDAMTEDEIHEFINDYAQGAANAIKAGFDGVEIHGANGYLIDQFWQDVSNQRTDAWGGSIEKRAKFGLEVTKAIIKATGDSKKVAIRLSPYVEFQGMGMGDRTIDNFTYITKELLKLDLAYIHFIESRISGSAADGVYRTAEDGTVELDPFIKVVGTEVPIIIAGGYTPEKARKVVGDMYTSDNILIGFGRYFISTPDLPFRLQHNIELNPYERKTFYTPGEGGYTDYPFSKEFLAAQADSKL